MFKTHTKMLLSTLNLALPLTARGLMRRGQTFDSTNVDNPNVDRHFVDNPNVGAPFVDRDKCRQVIFRQGQIPTICIIFLLFGLPWYVLSLHFGNDLAS